MRHECRPTEQEVRLPGLSNKRLSEVKENNFLMVTEISIPGEGLDLPVRLPVLELESMFLCAIEYPNETLCHSTGSQQRLCKVIIKKQKPDSACMVLRLGMVCGVTEGPPSTPTGRRVWTTPITGGVPPGNGPPGLGGPRPVKRRGTANRKERRRTQSINSAFAELRECIPNVPADTKLSKIKTLRLATSYIAYLMDLLAKDDQNGEAEAFKAEIKKTDVKEEKRKKELNEILKSTVSGNDKKTKGRTGWPQHVWALELKQ
ncbi:Hand2 [Columba livia]|nr:Hand2 [Columba livia]